MAQSKWDVVVVQGDALTDTAKATLMEIDGEQIWLPKSQFKRMSEQPNKRRPQQWAVFIPRWLAEEKEIDYIEEDDWDDLKDE